jgi:MFS family permease
LLAVSTIEDWRRFGAPRFRVYHSLALAQGVVGVLAGFDVVIPFALAIGCPPFVAVLLGVLPLAGGMAQLVVPRLLDRTDGNLRGLTLFVACISEPRGLYLALLAALVTFGAVSGPLAIVLLATLIGVTSILSSIVGANLLSWHSAVLPESDRRLVVPRMMAISLAIGALLLLPMAAALDTLAGVVGPLAFALPFVISGTLGIVEIVVLRRLRHPGRVIVPPRAVTADADASPELSRFLRVSAINALGMGFAPSMSVFMISVVGLTAGFSMMVASIGTLTQVVAAAVAGSRLARGSSSHMLRTSFGIRALAMISPLFALPAAPFAPVFLIAASMLGAIGFVFGQLAANEKLFRLISGPAVIRHHARYLARTSGAMTIGQVAGAGVIALGGPLGYPFFAFLYAGSAMLRVVAYRYAAPTPAGAPSSAPVEAGVSAVA